jgi:hypothetical protein
MVCRQLRCSGTCPCSRCVQNKLDCEFDRAGISVGLENFRQERDETNDRLERLEGLVSQLAAQLSSSSSSSVQSVTQVPLTSSSSSSLFTSGTLSHRNTSQSISQQTRYALDLPTVPYSRQAPVSSERGQPGNALPAVSSPSSSSPSFSHAPPSSAVPGHPHTTAPSHGGEESPSASKSLTGKDPRSRLEAATRPSAATEPPFSPLVYNPRDWRSSTVDVLESRLASRSPSPSTAGGVREKSEFMYDSGPAAQGILDLLRKPNDPISEGILSWDLAVFLFDLSVYSPLGISTPMLLLMGSSAASSQSVSHLYRFFPAGLPPCVNDRQCSST